MIVTKTPGVYIEEIPHLPPSIAEVQTAIPAFIGFTQKADWKTPGDLRTQKMPWRIKSMLEYVQYFGYPDPEKDGLSVAFTSDGKVNAMVDETKRSKFLMYYSLQIFFDNGGGPCWIMSVGDYLSSGGGIIAQNLIDGLDEIAKINEVTLLVFPDAINLDNDVDYYNIHTKAIDQCVKLQDRFTVMDVYHVAGNLKVWDLDVNGVAGTGGIRNWISGDTDHLKYAAAYFK